MRPRDKTGWLFVCPCCGRQELPWRNDSAVCTACHQEFECRDKVANLLPPQRRRYFAEFLEGYNRIRRAEGRADGDATHYRRLPHCPPEHPLAWQWRIRRRSFGALRCLLRAHAAPGWRILDLGAGVGWLSNRLHEAGFAPCAVDITADSGDGLGAARHFDGDWPRIVAEFDHLPLATASVNAAVFNGSIHYSTDYERTLSEARRVVQPGGLIVILDSPVYTDGSSGERMLAEQHADFERRFGERSDALPVAGFLTWTGLDALGRRSHLEWRHRKPWYGVRWAVRPLLARLRRRREPASFALIWAVR